MLGVISHLEVMEGAWEGVHGFCADVTLFCFEHPLILIWGRSGASLPWILAHPQMGRNIKTIELTVMSDPTQTWKLSTSP